MAVSTIQNNEYVLLIASYAALINPKSDKKELLTRKYTEQQLAFIKKTQTRTVQLLNVIFKRDASDLQHPFFNYIMRSYNNFKSFGHYPNGKSLNEQNNKLIEYYNVLAMLDAEQEKAQLKEQEKQAKKKR